MRFIKLLILLQFFGSCTIQNYVITSDPQLINSFRIVKTGDPILNPPVSSYHMQNKIILIPLDYTTGEVMQNVMALLPAAKYRQLKNYLATVSADEVRLPFAKGLLNLFEGREEEALTEFKNCQLRDIQYIIDMLIADCEYEINYEDESDYYSFLQKYQDIIDNYELSENYKEIINNRIKLIRYKM